MKQSPIFAASAVCAFGLTLGARASLLGPETNQAVANSAANAKPLPVGSMAPDATLRGMDGKPIRLSKVIAGKPSVIILYRGGWCPFCNAQLSDLVTVEAEIRRRGYQIIAISPDRPEELNKMSSKDHLTYKLFSDSSAEAIRKFGVAFRVDDETVAKMREFHVDLERSSGETHHILPVPSVFIVDRSGKVVFVHSNPDFKVRMKGSEILQVIDRSFATEGRAVQLTSDDLVRR